MSTLNDTALTTLGRKIKTARTIADMKQEDLARYVGVSRSAVGQWEKDETEPSALKLIVIARATKQPLGWFAEGLDLGTVRHKGLEPLTFWLGVILAHFSRPKRDALDTEYEALCAEAAIR